MELLDKGHTIKMGQFIYERLANRHQMERFTYNKTDTVFVPLDGERYNMTDIEVLSIQEGPVWTSLYIHGIVPECADNRGVNMEIRLYNKEKLLEIHYDMHKLAVTEPEAVYVAFPFDLDDSRLYFEAQGGLVSPGVNQLEGTSSDWNTIQNFASVRNDKSQIVFGSNDIPLVQFGDVNTGKYYYKHQPETSFIYSWVLNNYWTTNFKASQEGEMKWSYYITSSSDNSNAFASRFGWGNRIPLLTRVFPAAEEEAVTSSLSLIDIDIPNILLINAKPSMDGNGIILHLRETEGESVSLDINTILNSNKFTTVSEVNVFEEVLVDIEDKLALEAFEAKFIKLKN